MTFQPWPQQSVVVCQQSESRFHGVIVSWPMRCTTRREGPTWMEREWMDEFLSGWMHSNYEGDESFCRSCRTSLRQKKRDRVIERERERERESRPRQFTAGSTTVLYRYTHDCMFTNCLISSTNRYRAHFFSYPRAVPRAGLSATCQRRRKDRHPLSFVRIMLSSLGQSSNKIPDETNSIRNARDSPILGQIFNFI